ncbi:hypothetical protein G5S_0809 [Chlamydia pecorum E58]|uniref:Uncharacterized protein n=1 Tax=Chlamydia pecorum (strain ATCC VR-628 / DSM 29919 / E58) TaxID=331635 RepID=A0AA34WI46_CHLPE|nr:hypothetical protein G5S_0809 [Chlamydia pecorum E58]
MPCFGVVPRSFHEEAAGDVSMEWKSFNRAYEM